MYYYNSYSNYIELEKLVKTKLGKHYKDYNKPMSYFNCVLRSQHLNFKEFKYEEYFNPIINKYEKSPLPLQFKRNQCIGNRYFADFVNFHKMLIIEVDEERHKLQKDYDKKRDKFLTLMGFRVIRLKVSEKDSWEKIVDNCIFGYFKRPSTGKKNAKCV